MAKKKWRTRVKGTKRQVGQKIRIDTTSMQGKKAGLPAISPRGHKLAFHGRKLVLRSIDALEKKHAEIEKKIQRRERGMLRTYATPEEKLRARTAIAYYRRQQKKIEERIDSLSHPTRQYEVLYRTPAGHTRLIRINAKDAASAERFVEGSGKIFTPVLRVAKAMKPDRYTEERIAKIIKEFKEGEAQTSSKLRKRRTAIQMQRDEELYDKLLNKQAKIRHEYEKGIWSKDGRDVELAKIQEKIDELTGNPKPRKTMFFPSKSPKYSEIVKMDTPENAHESCERLSEEFLRAKTRTKKVRVLRVTQLAANRAGATLKRKRLSTKERGEFRSIAKSYENCSDAMQQKLGK